MKFNLFDFATRELSHSAFFAWLIRQIDPRAVEYGQDVRDAALLLVNRMLTRCEIEPIVSLKDVQECVVEREEEHIDITAYIRLQERAIALVIENKVGAHESSEHQLVDYHEIGEKLTKDHFKDSSSKTAFIYLKSDYDFEDPLIRCDGNGKRIVTGFQKLDWKDIHRLLGNRDFTDSILKSYSRWISANHDRIERSLTLDILLSTEGESIQASHHAGQVTLIKAVFNRLVGGKTPCSMENKGGQLLIRYDCDSHISLGTDRGNPWSQLWGWTKGGLWIFYRLQIHYEGNNPKPRLHVKTYANEKGFAVDEKARIRDLCDKLVGNNKLSDIWLAARRWSPSTLETDIGSFGVVGTSIDILRKIEDFHEQLCAEAGLLNSGRRLCPQSSIPITMPD